MGKLARETRPVGNLHVKLFISMCVLKFTPRFYAHACKGNSLLKSDNFYTPCKMNHNTEADNLVMENISGVAVCLK